MLVEFERAIIRERTKAGLEAARARGSCFGRRLSSVGATIAPERVTGANRTFYAAQHRSIALSQPGTACESLAHASPSALSFLSIRGLDSDAQRLPFSMVKFEHACLPHKVAELAEAVCARIKIRG